MSNPSESFDGKHEVDHEVDNFVVDADSGVDVAVNFVLAAGVDAENEEPIPPEVDNKLRWKLDLRLLPVLFILYTLQFIDKQTLGASSILGIIQDTNLTNEQFNTLQSAFYIGYLVFEIPQNFALQRFPVARWVAIQILLWAILIGLMPIGKNFGGLFALRFFLGATEGSVTAGLMILTSMFYTRREIAERLGWTLQCNGIGTIISGFISFGVFHTSTTAHPNQWQLQMIIISGLTLVCGTIFFFTFPNNPMTARFLSPEEKLLIVRRTSANQNGIETKKWKKEQFYEALTDPKTWLFFLFATVSNLQNGIGAQYSLIIKGFGFTTLQTTLLNIPSGFAQIISITLAMYMLRRMPNSRAYLAVLFFVPSVIAAILLMTLPLSNSVGLLCSFYVLNFGGAPSFVLVVSWVTSSVAGHTKRVTTNGIFLMGYALGQVLCTQPWQAQYKPRDLVPWGVCLASYVGDFILLFTIRALLNRENKRRDALQAADSEKGGAKKDETGFVEIHNADGTKTRRRVDKALLDLTDRQNLDFRYVL